MTTEGNGGGGGSVRITQREIYDEVVASRNDIRELQGDVKDALAKGEDHETRLRDLERLQIGTRVEALESWRTFISRTGLLTGIGWLIMVAVALLAVVVR